MLSYTLPNHTPLTGYGTQQIHRTTITHQQPTANSPRQMVSNKTTSPGWQQPTHPHAKNDTKERSQKQWLEHLLLSPATYANTTPNTET
nr:MAG TPA: hypothetical protein [Caudoviricetes sp.]